MNNTLQPSPRLEVVDALRGLALLGIVLLHNLEHFNIYFIPENLPDWLKFADKYTWDTIFLVFAGKAYAIFSLLFGFSFYIQLSNAKKRGTDFRMRFAWRMLLLFMFAQLHALFYNGDILVLYAVCGLFLIPACTWKDKTVFIIAIILLLQPWECGKFIYAIFNPQYTPSPDLYMKYAAISVEATQNGSFFEVLRTNLIEGQLFSNLWQIENGRLFQATGLFYMGMLAGRRKYFIKSYESTLLWKKILKMAAIAFIPLYIINTYVITLITNPVMLIPFAILIPSITNFALMMVIVSGFTLLWFSKDNGYAWQKITVPYGRMSLTNYISQSIIGVCIYYGFGLSLYKYTGSVQTVMIAIVIFGAQLTFSRYWLQHHKQGPLEYIWKKLTWLKFK